VVVSGFVEFEDEREREREMTKRLLRRWNSEFLLNWCQENV
jgi:hypothetical protein